MSMDYGIFGQIESQEQVAQVLVIRERRRIMTWADFVPLKGSEFPWIAQRATTSRQLEHWSVKKGVRLW